MNNYIKDILKLLGSDKKSTQVILFVEKDYE